MSRRASSSAAQRKATHCDALLKRQIAPAELIPEIDRLGDRWAAAMCQSFAQTWGVRALQARSLGARMVSPAELAKAAPKLAAHSLHSFGEGHQLLFSIDGRALLEQLDRAFGGTGELGDKLPKELPFSANLLAERSEAAVSAAIAAELGGMPLVAGARDADIARILPFAKKAELVLLTVEFTAGTSAPWQIHLATESEHLPLLLARQSSPAADRPVRKRSMTEAPIADVPFEASAIVVDMPVPLHRLASLTPGSVLPIIVARNVPLRIGETTIARGTVGDIDDQVALQISQTFSGKDSK